MRVSAVLSLVAAVVVASSVSTTATASSSTFFCPAASSGFPGEFGASYNPAGMYSAGNGPTKSGNYLSVATCAPTCLRTDSGATCTKFLDGGDFSSSGNSVKATCCADKSSTEYGTCETSSNCNGMNFMVCNGGNCPNFGLPEANTQYTCEVDNPACAAVPSNKCWGKVKCWSQGSGGKTNVAGTSYCGQGQFGDIRTNMVCIADGSGANNVVSKSQLTNQYYITGNLKICGSCAPSFSHGDPQFSGFLGQSYQVHGQTGAIHNILTTPTMQYNALFTYLSEGACRKGTDCFSHPGNYFGEVGLMVRSEDPASQLVNRVRVVSGPVDVGLTATIDGVEMVPGGAVQQLAGCVQLQLVNQFTLRVESCSDFSLTIENSDFFLNQDVSVGSQMLDRIASVRQAARADNETLVEEMRTEMPHGILGQTWEMRNYDNRWKYLQGHVYDYIVADGIFGTQFKYNRF